VLLKHVDISKRWWRISGFDPVPIKVWTELAHDPLPNSGVRELVGTRSVQYGTFSSTSKWHGSRIFPFSDMYIKALRTDTRWDLCNTNTSRLDETSKFTTSTVTFWPNQNVHCNILSLWQCEPCTFSPDLCWTFCPSPMPTFMDKMLQCDIWPVLI
jgi:hypothetical protein